MEAAVYHQDQDQDQGKRRGSTARDKRRVRGAIRLVDKVLEEKREVDEEVHEEKRDEDEEIVGYRRHWENCYAHRYGCFEDTTIVPPMRYTFVSTPEYAAPDDGLQIFSIKITQLKEEEGLHWPLHVYGLIATRDSIDHRRNLLFQRTRDNCQTIAQEDPFLLLTGPSRAVVLIDPVAFEVQLKAKGKTESEDKVLIFSVLISQYACGYLGDPPRIITYCLDGYRSELEVTFALIPRSVEATFRVEVVHGSWPDHLRVLVVTRTASLDKDIVLLDSRDGRMSISNSGVFELSRRVVSVELYGELEVDIVALQLDGHRNSSVFAKQVGFMPNEGGVSYDTCNLGFCEVRITVGWSLLASVDLERPNPERLNHENLNQHSIQEVDYFVADLFI